MESMETATTTKTYKRTSQIDKPAKVMSAQCDRCGGSGIFHIWGACFRCGGNGIDPTYKDWGYPVDWTDEQCEAFAAHREIANAKARQRAAARRQAKRDAQWQRNLEECPLLGVVQNDIMAATEEAPHRWAGFMQDIVWKASDFDISPKQVAAFEAGYKREMQWAEERRLAEEGKSSIPAWEAGRQVVTGEVATRRGQDTQFGYVVKLRIVDAEGRGLWVTEPASIQCEVGDKVTMTVTVEPSQDDHTFAFGKRPSKAEVL